MGPRLFLFFFALLFSAVPSLHALALGATRSEVIQQLGTPLSHASLGNREILTYAKHVRIVLEDGLVVRAEQIELTVEDPSPTPVVPHASSESNVEADTPAAPPPTVEPTPLPAVSRPRPRPTEPPKIPDVVATNSIIVSLPSSPPVITPTTQPTLPSLQPGPIASAGALAPDSSKTLKPILAAKLGPTPEPTFDPEMPLGADATMGAVPTLLAKFSAANGGAAVGSADNTSSLKRGARSLANTATHSPSVFDAKQLPLPGQLMLLSFHFAVTLIALYLAFRIWSMESLPSGIFAIAGIDVVLHGICEAAGPATSGLSTMSPVENGIPGIVMIFTIRHFCFNKRIPEAVRVAAVVKIAVFVMKLLATATLLDFVFNPN